MNINFTEKFCIFGLLKIIVSKCPNILLSNLFLTDITNEIFQAFPANMLQDKTGNIKLLLNIVEQLSLSQQSIYGGVCQYVSGEGDTGDMCHYVMTMSSIWVESESAARPGLSAY